MGLEDLTHRWGSAALPLLAAPLAGTARLVQAGQASGLRSSASVRAYAITMFLRLLTPRSAFRVSTTSRAWRAMNAQSYALCAVDTTTAS